MLCLALFTAEALLPPARQDPDPMPDWLALPGFFDVLDILLVAGIGWIAIGTLRRTRARSAVLGLALVTLVYIIARGLELRLTAALLQGFFAVAVLVLVVVFQEDLRRFFEGLGTWRPGRETPPSDDFDELVRAAAHLASTRTGALIVLPLREDVERHLTGGIELNGRLSEPLLLSLFDASSPGHDGAVLVRDQRVERFAVHLPLSSDRDALGSRGTRHAAALGLSERCDALVIAVSEETGSISIARNGSLRVLDRPERLGRELRDARQETPPEEPLLQRRDFREAALALVGALGLWMLLVPGSDIVERTVAAKVVVSNLPADLVLETLDPPTVEVVLQGRRRDQLLAERSPVTIQLDAYLARLGRRTFSIEEGTVKKPSALDVLAVSPDKVRLSLEPAPTVDPAPDPPPGESL